MDRIKVLLICHFSNHEVRARLSLWEDREYHDFAVWISNTIKGFRHTTQIDLHVVSPHQGMQTDKQSFEIDGVKYHFYSTKPSFDSYFEHTLNKLLQIVKNKYAKSTINTLKKFTIGFSYKSPGKAVESIVKSINPDLVHLNGAENPYYSATILRLNKLRIPIVVLVQAVLDDPGVIASNPDIDWTRIYLERRILRTNSYFIVGTKDHYSHVKSMNSKAFTFFSPGIRTISINPIEETVKKEFDFVFFARIVPNKGIEHLLRAMAILVKDSAPVSLLFFGPVADSYLKQLKILMGELGIQDNVEYGGHIAKIEDLHRMALQAKVYVLPTLFEGLATSAVEAMLLGLPVVTYATGGMPFLNQDGENVLMCETGDIDGLARNMKRLMDNPDFASELALKGQAFAQRTFGELSNVELRVRQYRAIIEHYHRRTPIPEDLVFTGVYDH